jgi:hypothetical protein
MTTQNYLMIQENVVTNIVVWDGNTQTWQPPQNAIMLVEATTPIKTWGLINKEYVLVDSVGGAGIGFTYDGTYCVTNDTKPEVPSPAPNQPEASGTVTI